MLLRRSRGRVSIVIPALNEGDLLRMTVESIRDRTHYPAWEILIVDDGSTDGSAEPFRTGDPRVRVVTGGGLGVARARNLGAQCASGSYLVFIDAHCRVSPEWLDALADTLRHTDVGLVGPTFTRLEHPEPRGCGMVWKDATLDPAWFEPASDRAYPVPLTTGACQAFRRDTFAAIGGYEDGFTRWGFEDVEMCVRTWLFGYRVMADPRAIVAHYFRESRNYEVDDGEITLNFLRMIHLHFSPPRIRRVLRAVSGNPLVPSAIDRLYGSDIFRRRRGLELARVRSDDWFFDRVNGPV